MSQHTDVQMFTGEQMEAQAPSDVYKDGLRKHSVCPCTPCTHTHARVRTLVGGAWLTGIESHSGGISNGHGCRVTHLWQAKGRSSLHQE